MADATDIECWCDTDAMLVEGVAYEDESVCSVCSRLTGFGDEDKGEPPVNLARCPSPGGLECRAVAQAVAPLRRENEVLRSNVDHLSSENASLVSHVESMAMRIESLAGELAKPEDVRLREVLDALDGRAVIFDGLGARVGHLLDEMDEWIERAGAAERRLKKAEDVVARRVIATAPKPRDESVPPPDWSLHPCTVHGRPGLQVHRNDETGAVIDGLMLCAGDVVPRSEADAVTRALWAKYDREHGYAPDEASIRADERARCESEVERLRAAVATMREQVLQSAAFCGAPGFACRGAMAQALDAALATAAPPDPAALATETPREKLRRDLDENAKRWASYPAEVRAAISTAEVFAVAPAEPAPDPWVLPEPLEWRHDTDGWYVTDGEYWLRLSYDNAGSVLRRRDDGDHLIDLIRRRNAAEPQGPA